MVHIKKSEPMYVAALKVGGESEHRIKSVHSTEKMIVRNSIR